MAKPSRIIGCPQFQRSAQWEAGGRSPPPGLRLPPPKHLEGRPHRCSYPDSPTLLILPSHRSESGISARFLLVGGCSESSHSYGLCGPGRSKVRVDRPLPGERSTTGVFTCLSTSLPFENPHCSVLLFGFFFLTPKLIFSKTVISAPMVICEGLAQVRTARHGLQ